MKRRSESSTNVNVVSMLRERAVERREISRNWPNTASISLSRTVGSMVPA
ncbi:hypothetical protein NHF46_15340 [Arthrobacter alpinus]|nr:hypothetical protein [Arthrobacter alpinus]